MDDYVTKPIDPQELFAVIERHLLFRVLVADDHADSLVLAGRIFTEIGWQVTLAANISQCVWECKNSRFDLILLEAMMPGMEPEKIASLTDNLAKETGRRAHITVLSGDINREIHDRCLAVGINDFLVKPLTKEIVTTLINDLRTQKKTSPLPA
jgi:CheY-like chemotaxis protein